MVRLNDLAPSARDHLLALECPQFAARPFISGPPLSTRRVAIITTAGLMQRGDPPFRGGEAGYRAFPGDAAARNLLMSHISVNFDRTGFQEDANVVFPIDRLRDLAAAGSVGSVASVHYSFMGATDPRAMEPHAHEIADRLKQDQVDAVLLTPV